MLAGRAGYGLPGNWYKFLVVSAGKVLAHEVPANTVQSDMVKNIWNKLNLINNIVLNF